MEAFKDYQQQRWALQVQENIEILLGVRGNVEDQALTWHKIIELGYAYLKDNDLTRKLEKAPAFTVQSKPVAGWTGQFVVVNEAAMTTQDINVVNGEVQSWAGAFAAVDHATAVTVTITVSGGLCSPDGQYDVVNPLSRRTETMTIENGKILRVV